jgi:hypothetical protein
MNILSTAPTCSKITCHDTTVLQQVGAMSLPELHQTEVPPLCHLTAPQPPHHVPSAEPAHDSPACSVRSFRWRRSCLSCCMCLCSVARFLPILGTVAPSCLMVINRAGWKGTIPNLPHNNVSELIGLFIHK